MKSRTAIICALIAAGGYIIAAVLGVFPWPWRTSSTESVTQPPREQEISPDRRGGIAAEVRVNFSRPTWEDPSPEPNGAGYMLLSREANAFRVTLELTGLTPNETYLLTLNGKVGDPGNEQLKTVQDKVTSEGEGFADVGQVTADETGQIARDVEFALPRGEYDVKFFVKQGRDPWKVVLYNDVVRFSIR